MEAGLEEWEHKQLAKERVAAAMRDEFESRMSAKDATATALNEEWQSRLSAKEASAMAGLEAAMADHDQAATSSCGAR
jgi:hypothetical protein